MTIGMDVHGCCRIAADVMVHALVFTTSRGTREEVEVSFYFTLAGQPLAQEYADAIKAVNRRHPELFTEEEREDMGFGVEAEAAGGASCSK